MNTEILTKHEIIHYWLRETNHISTYFLILCIIIIKCYVAESKGTNFCIYSILHFIIVT